MRPSRSWLLLFCLIPARGAAQLAPVGIPRGMFRFEVDGSFQYANDRYNDGTKESLGANFTSTAFGSAQIPTLAEADARIAVLLGDPSYRLNLGASVGTAQMSTGTGAFSLGLGVTKGLSIFGRLPIVSSWWRQSVSLDTASSNAGVNPALIGNTAPAAFFTTFNASLATLQDQIASGVYDGDPAARALAVQTLASGQALSDRLNALFLGEGTASPFLPLSQSAAGGILNGQVTTIQQNLSTLGVTGFSIPLPLPSTPVSEADLEAFATDPSGPYAYGTLTNSRRTGMGDVEVGAVYTFIDHWNADEAKGTRLATSVTVRLPTGAVALPTDPFGVSLGAGSPAVGVAAVFDLGAGRLGARFSGSYLLQMSGDFTRRVGSPLSPLIPASATAEVTVNPGDELQVAIAPFFRLAPALGVVGSAAWAKRGEDDVAYTTAADSIPGVPASLLATGTSASRWLLSIGITYSSSGQKKDGTNGVPLDAGWRWQTTVASSGGIATSWSAIVFFARVYARVW